MKINFSSNYYPQRAAAPTFGSEKLTLANDKALDQVGKTCTKLLKENGLEHSDALIKLCDELYLKTGNAKYRYMADALVPFASPQFKQRQEALIKGIEDMAPKTSLWDIETKD